MFGRILQKSGEPRDSSHLLSNLSNGVDMILANNKREIRRDSPAVQSIAEILSDGLREPKNGFWHIVRELTHSTTRSTLARNLKHVHDHYERGLFWIYYTLVEGSLESYVQCLVNDSSTVKKYYADDSILRNPFTSTKFLLLVSNLAENPLTPVDSFIIGIPKLDLTDDSFSETKTTSLPSPGDSGVALFDSDDNTSEIVTDKTEEDLTLIEDMSDPWRNEDDATTPVGKSALEEAASRKASFEDCPLSRVTSDPGLVVLRRKAKGKEDGGTVKRVSFHEEVEEAEQNRKNSLRVRERYSLQEDSTCRRLLAQIFAGGGVVVKPEEKALDAYDVLKKDPEDGRGNEEERGVPEGQEDPATLSETDTLRSRRSHGSRELRRNLLRKTLPEELRKTSKTPLLNRFLRSLPSGGSPEASGRGSRKARRRSLYLGPREVPEPEGGDEVDREIEEELRRGIRERGNTLEERLIRGLKNVLCCDRIYKVFRLSDLEGEAYLGVLTESKLMVMSTVGLSRCTIKRCLDYKEIDSVFVGPNSSVLVLVLSNESRVVLVPWFGEAEQLCSWLDTVSRRCKASLKPINFVCLALKHMSSLSSAVNNRLKTKDEECLDYVWVRGEETKTEPESFKVSHLMFKIKRQNPWCPGLVTLKGRALRLKSETFEGSFDLGDVTLCNRVNSSRPYTFLVKFNSNFTLVIAAPSDHEMSEWKQAIIQAAFSAKWCGTPTEANPMPKSYGLVLTQNHLLLTTFPETVVNYTNLSDVSNIRVHNAHCLLELDCHEVRESNGDWILYFPTQSTMHSFIERITELRPNLKQMILEEEPSTELSIKCRLTENKIFSNFQELILSYSSEV